MFVEFEYVHMNDDIITFIEAFVTHLMQDASSKALHKQLIIKNGPKLIIMNNTFRKWKRVLGSSPHNAGFVCC